jgi:hypothetical protein
MKLHSKSTIFITLFSCVIFLFSCGPKEQKISNEEAVMVAKTIEERMAKHDAAILNSFINEKEFAKRMRKITGGKYGIELRKGVASALTERKIGNEVLKNMGNEGSYQFVKSYVKDNRQHLIFRLFTSDNAINYHDFELVKLNDKIKAADVYVYTTGENFSKTLVDLLGPTMNTDDWSAAEKERVNLITKLNNYNKKKEFTESKKLLDNSPAEFKKEKIYHLLQMQVATSLDDDEAHNKAVADYKASFPDEPNIYLVQIDYFFAKEDYAGSLECVNKLDSIINKDVFLDYYRALIYKMMSEHTQMRNSLERLRTSFPKFSKGLVELMYLYADEEEYEKAAAILSEYKQLPDKKQEFIDDMYLLYPEVEKWTKP